MVKYEQYDTIDFAVVLMRYWTSRGAIDKSTKEIIWMLIRNVLCFWTGQPHVGVEKSDNVKNAYHLFFKTLHELLLKLKQSANDQERAFAERALYQGVLYRYLGYGDASDIISEENERISPKYDGIYVSWSKNPSNDYILSRLKGPVTLLTCNTGDLSGIDISTFGFEAGGEPEVVFPTLEKCIVSVEYHR